MDGPDLSDGFDAIPTRRHAHIDEGHWVRGSGGLSLADFLKPLATLESGVDLKATEMMGAFRFAEQFFFDTKELGVVDGLALENFSKVLVDGGVIIDDEDSGGGAGFHAALGV